MWFLAVLFSIAPCWIKENHYVHLMVFEYNCWKPLSTSNGFPQQNGFGIPVRWWWWTTVLMMKLKILETISTEKWVWSTTHRNHFHNKMVLAFRYGDDDERWCWWWDWRFQWWWWWTVIIQFVFAFGGVESNYVGIYARCIRISLCTITTPLVLYTF